MQERVKKREGQNSLEKQLVIGLKEEIDKRTQGSDHVGTRLIAAGQILYELSQYDALVPRGSFIADVLPDDKKSLSGLLTGYHHYIRDTENYTLSTTTLAEIAAFNLELA